ncbi:acyltransferase [Pseudomonas sp. ME-P-057]|uniref:acyltransferase family protein n=1 Tax=Pseudomonas sp. ME-P-057 TaxID=3040321 RepID=UPI002555D031|nr:acyltransferase [Pseudomonas sp. ME-P-057]
MGAYRLLLAVLVAISHMGVTFFGYNPGVFAVISFLVISGFVMTSLIKRNYLSARRIPAFYLDRALRLYPQFLLYFAISCVIISTYLSTTKYNLALTAANIIPSLAIAPLNLWMFGITIPDILPPAWSLGLEAFFYLSIPFLIIYRARMPFYVASIAFFYIACLGYVNTDVYGYRLLPGVLFMFLCGSYLYDGTRAEKALTIVTCMAALVTLAAILSGVILQAPFNTEVTAGLAFGIPTIFLLSKFPYSKIDEFFGNISYGVFLNHFVVMYAAEALGYRVFSTEYVIAVLCASFFCSVASYYLVERPALELRHVLRERNKQMLSP